MATILEAGTYRAKAVEGALGLTSTGKEQVAVKFAFTEPGLVQSHITWYGYFTDATHESTFRALRTAGWKGQDLADLSDLASPETPEVDLVVHHETDQQGNLRARVRWVNGTGGVGLKTALDPDKAKAFAARMKGKLAAFDKGAKAAPKPNGAKAKAPELPQEELDKQAEQQSDDIPF